MRKTRLAVAGLLMAAVLTSCSEKIDLIDTNVSTVATTAADSQSSSEAATAQTQPSESQAQSSAVQTTEAQPTESQAPETQPSDTQPSDTQPTSNSNAEIPDGVTVSQIVKPNSNLNLRVGPGTDYESAGLLPEGTEVTRIVKGGTWSVIRYNGKEYYVASQYLDLVADGETVDPNQVITTEAPQSSGVSPTAAKGEILDFSGYSLADLEAIDNTSVDFGYAANDRDANNIPNGVYYYQKLYGKYGGDYIGDTTKKVIYLTMDEGYEAGYTPTILDVLKEKKVKAVFFVTKQFVTEHPELVTRMIEEGHTIGNHTCKHPAAGMPSLGLQAEHDDIMWLHNYVLENWGYEMKLFRYPSGISSEQSLALVNSLGYNPVFWSYAHMDWVEDNQPDPATALQNCLNQVHPGAIYLLHAVSKTNTENMAAFIDGCRALGYEFGEYPANGF